jgi:hypothetical protein
VSKIDETPCTVWFLWAAAPPRNVNSLLLAATAAMEAIGARPRRLLIGEQGRSPRRAPCTAAQLAKVSTEPKISSIGIFGKAGSDETQIDLFLSDQSGSERATIDRHVMLISPTHTSHDDADILSFLRAAIGEYPVVHGGATRVPSWGHAVAEAHAIKNGTIDWATNDRVGFDSRADLGPARRLYPVTIFGPALWASLPPLPALDPMPKVEDLGECKMLTCWPELVAPHDPAFLAGTRELRQWLWPHTIQNPMDNPEAVERRLTALWLAGELAAPPSSPLAGGGP